MLLTSCSVSKTAVLSPDNEWYRYEQLIDGSADCDQLHNAYTSFYKKLIADDGKIGESEWKQYLKTTIFLERKINRKGRRLCGYTFFAVIPAPIESEYIDTENPYDDLDPFEDLFDYDEFDSNR